MEHRAVLGGVDAITSEHRFPTILESRRPQQRDQRIEDRIGDPVLREIDDEVGAPGTGAIAVGALPFDPSAEAVLVGAGIAALDANDAPVSR